MSWDFDYVKAWRELAMPLFAALPEDRKRLVMDTCLAVAGHRQNKALHIDWPEGDAGVELRRRFHEVPQAELAAMSRIVYFFGHWLPGLEELDKLEPGLPDAVAPYIRRGPPEGPFKIAQQNLSLWKFSNLADQVLHGRLGMDPQREFDTGCGQSYAVIEGFLRLQFSGGGGWQWEEMGLAVPEVLERLRGYSARELFDCDELLEAAKAECAPEGPLAGFLAPKGVWYTHKEGTPLDEDEIVYEFRGRLAGTPFVPTRIAHANWRLVGPNASKCGLPGHPFVIGPAHFKGDTCYLDPRSAPCAFRHSAHSGQACLCTPAEHVCDKVLMLRPLRDCSDVEVHAAVMSALSRLKELGLDFVGFEPTRNKYVVRLEAVGEIERARKRDAGMEVQDAENAGEAAVQPRHAAAAPGGAPV